MTQRKYFIEKYIFIQSDPDNRTIYVLHDDVLLFYKRVTIGIEIIGG